MSSARRTALGLLKDWVNQSKSRRLKLIRGNGDVGTRAAPTRSGKNDENIGSRVDFGPIVVKDGNKEHRRFFFQLNKDADNSTIKKLAQKDSHKVWSSADIMVKENPTTEEVDESLERFFEELNDNMEDE